MIMDNGSENLNSNNANPEETILAIRGEVYSMGANDHEMPEFDNILKKLRARECTPEDALKEARKIRGNKEDYH